ncbi:MAG: FHA domain-containing protein [Nannocystaceae bacterium]|nr:FHA domain-containing protein [Nannocystaceae bacterium]
MIRISIAEAGKPPRLLTFSKSEVTLGREASNDLCLTGKGVSGRHCRLVRNGEAIFIEDMGSTNGTYVNRVRVAAPTQVTSSDDLVVAVYRIQVLNDFDSGQRPRPAEGPAGGSGVVERQVSAAHPSAAHPSAAHPSAVAAGPTYTAPAQPHTAAPPLDATAPGPTNSGQQPKARVPAATDLDWGREWEQIDRLTTAWFKHGRPRRGLLRGEPLASARRWLARGRGKHPQPKPAHRQFIDAGARRRTVQIFGRVTLAGVLLGGAGVGGVFAYRMRSEGGTVRDGTDSDGVLADTKQDLGDDRGAPKRPDGAGAAALAETASELLDDDPVLAALLAAEAAARLSGSEATQPDHPVSQVLRRALARIGSQALLGHGGPVAAVAISNDGRLVASSTRRRGEPVRLWDTGRSGVVRPSLLSNHAGRVTDMAITDDGRWLLTADDDGLVMRWDLTSDDAPSSGVRMDAHTTAVEAMHLAGSWLVTGDGTGRAWLWNVDERSPHAIALKGNEAKITGLAVTADGVRVASVSEDGTGRIWTLDNGVVRRRVPTLTRPEELGVGPLLSVAISPDGTWVLTGASDGTAWLWKAGSVVPGRGAPPPLAGKHQGAITHVGFSNDGAVAYTAGQDGKVVPWDMTLDNPNDKVLPWVGHKGGITAVDVTGPVQDRTSSDGVAYLVSASRDGTARRWNLDDRDGAIEVEILSGHTGAVQALDVSADGRWAVTGGEDKTARVFPVWRKGRPDRRRAVGLGAARVGFGHAGPVRAQAMNRGGNRLVTASDDGTARVWDLVGDGRLRSLGVLGGHRGPVGAVAITAKAQFAATGAAGGDLRLWKLEKTANPGQGHLSLKGHTQDIRGLHFTKKYLVSISTDGTARLWDMATADPNVGVVVLRHGDEVVESAVSGDGRWLLTATGTELRGVLWDLAADDPAAGNLKLKGHSDTLTAVALGPRGQWGATGSRDYRVHLYDLSRGKPKRTKLRKHDGDISALSFAPSARWLATADGKGAVLIWDLESKHPDEDFVRMKGPTGGVYALSWSADSQWLLGASADRGVYLWPVPGEGGGAVEPVILEGHEGVVSGVDISRNAAFAVSSGFDGTARLWPLTAEALVPIACGRVGRWLSDVEWHEHVGGEFMDRCPARGAAP